MSSDEVWICDRCGLEMNDESPGHVYRGGEERHVFGIDDDGCLQAMRRRVEALEKIVMALAEVFGK